MTDHEAMGETIAKRTQIAWEQHHAFLHTASELTMLQLAHTALGVDTRAQYLWLEQTDQEGDHMTFWHIMCTDGIVLGSDVASEEALDTLATNIEGYDLQAQPFWIEHGGRKMGYKGEFNVHGVIEHLGPKYQAYTDPMPNDPAALNAWLDKD